MLNLFIIDIFSRILPCINITFVFLQILDLLL